MAPFDFDQSPFHVLSPAQQQRVRVALDLAYYVPGEVILSAGTPPQYLWVNLKGHVGQFEGQTLVATHGPGDVWDGRSLVAEQASHHFVAHDEVIAYLLPRALVMSLVAESDTFGALLFADLGAKLRAVADQASAHELHTLTLSRVDQAHLRPLPQVSASTSVLEAVRLLRAHDCRALLVQDESVPRRGLFTPTAVQYAVLDGRPLDQLPVGQFSGFPLITVAPHDTMGDALALLTRHRIHRLVVDDGQRVHGLLESLDVFSFLADHSHQIGLQIEVADTVADLAVAAHQIERMIGRLHHGGTRVELIARMVHALQDRLFERTWQLVAAPQVLAHSCLLVMGSEGRGEQLLKTDQDNALLLRDGFPLTDAVRAQCEAFSEALASFGYPPCPGGIMLSRPDWCDSATAFAQKVQRWMRLGDGESLMHLAIFMDARAVAGDAQLLTQAQAPLRAAPQHSPVFMGHFAQAIDAFGQEHGWWARLLHLGTASNSRLSLKREGLFALVHGARALALQAGVVQTGTAERLQALASLGVVTAEQARDWSQCLHFLMGMRLQAGLDDVARGQSVSGEVDLARLGTLDRDLLRDALSVVQDFRQFVRLQFRLDLL